MAVFRFTLGIPGFDDTLIPRVVGSLGILVLVANHLLGPDIVSATQVLGHVISRVCVVSLSHSLSIVVL